MMFQLYHLLTLTLPLAFRKTIALNNAGVQLLDRGEPAKAAKALTSAFYVFKKAYYKQKHQLPSMCNFESSSIDKVQSILLNANTHPRPSSTTVSSSPSPSGDKTPPEVDEDPVSVSVYKNPIHLPQEFEILQETVGFLSTTITFNLALANHLCGIELYERLALNTANPNSTMMLQNTTVMKHFQSAGRLYEYAIRFERARTHQNQSQQQRQQQQQNRDTHNNNYWYHPLC